MDPASHIDGPLRDGAEDLRQDVAHGSGAATTAGLVRLEPHSAAEGCNSPDSDREFDQLQNSNPFLRRWPAVAKIRFDDMGSTACFQGAIGPVATNEGDDANLAARSVASTASAEEDERRIGGAGLYADPTGTANVLFHKTGSREHLDSSAIVGEGLWVDSIDTSTEHPSDPVAIHVAPADGELPVVSIAPSSLAKIEGTGGTTAFTFTVSLDRPSTSAQTVRWNISQDSSANTVDATDFSASAPLTFSLVITFAPGETSETIAVNVVGDSILEPDEKFYVFIWGPSAGLKIGNSLAHATILDDELLKVFISAENGSFREGHSGTTPYTFTIALTKAALTSQTMQWSVTGTGFNPVDGADFSNGVLPSGIVTFAAGEMVKTITLGVAGDTEFEWDEQFAITLTSASPGLPIGAGQTTATIVTDDSSVQMFDYYAKGVEANNGVTQFTFRVFRSGTNTEAHDVSYSVSGSGTNPADAADFGGSLPSGKLSFLKGEYEKTITIDVTGDAAVEHYEEFTVTLSSPSAGLSITRASATGFITNDDGLYSETIMANGGSGHRVDIVYVAEGYTEAERDKFLSDAASLNSYIFSPGNMTVNDPFVTYKNFFNTSALYVPSKQSGYSTDDNKVDTAFGAAAHLADGRLVYGDTAAVLDTVKSVYSADQSELIIVLVNSDKYGGGGGEVAWTTSSNISSYQTALHEIGHSFAGLQDEYVDNALQVGDLSQVLKNSVHVWPSNNPAEVPWKDWLGYQDELGVVGIYEGGYYRSTGVWRATPTSKMLNSYSGFSAPQKEEFIKRFYDTVGEYALLHQESLVDWEGITPNAGLMNFRWAVDGQAVAGTESRLNLVELLKGRPDGPADMDISLDISDGSGFLRRAAALESSSRSLEATFSFLKKTLESTSNSYQGTVVGNYFVIGNDLPNDIVVKGTPDTGSYVEGGSGDDRIWGDTGNDILVGGVGLNHLYGGGGNDTALFHGNRAAFSISLLGGVARIAGAASVDVVEDVDWLQFGDARLNVAELRDVSIEGSAPAVVEGDAGATSYSFTIALGREAEASESVGWMVTGSGSSAASAMDFVGGVLPSGSVTFAPGQTSKVVTISVAGDQAFELDEEFTVTLVDATAGLVLGGTTTRGTIRNDDEVTVSIGTDSAVKAEGNVGTTAYKFTVSLDRVAETTVGIAWSLAGSGAHGADAADFGGMLPSGVLEFAPGETSRIVTVSISGDTTIEFDEEFTVSLSTTLADVILDHASMTGTIRNDDRSTVSVAPLLATMPEGQAGQTAYAFTVSLDQAGVTTQSIDWAVSGSGAHPADAADFGGTLPSGRVVFAAGEISKTVTVSGSADSAVELDETFAIALSNPSSELTIGTASAVGTYRNDDTSISIAALSAAKAEGNAGATAFTFTLTRSGDLAASHSVAWTVAGGGSNPVVASDFAGGVLPSGTVTFASGQSSATVTVQIQGDTTIEGDEGFVVALSDPSPGLTIAASTASGAIVNDDSMVSIAAAGAVKREGNAASTAFVFTVTRSGDLATSQSVAWQATGAGVDAAAASDFAGGVLPSGVVTFASGQSSATITINVAGEMAVEADERFAVTLSNASAGLTIAGASAEGTIVNDDAAASILAAAAVKPEGHAGPTAFTFTLTRSGDIAVSHSVAWAVAGTGVDPAGGSDVAGGMLPSGIVTFAPGETSTTVSVDVQGDTAVEGDEAFVIALSGPSTGLTIATASANGTIINDDAAVSIAATAAVLAEGNGGSTVFSFTLTRSGDIAASHSVAWTVAGAGANPAGTADFADGALPMGTVTFAAGETTKVVMVEVAGETVVEADEGFTVTLSNPSSGFALGGASASGTIQNDDRSTVSVVAQSAAKAEGNAGATASTFVISLSQSATVAQTVSWAVTATGSNPASASDFVGGVLPTGTAMFAAGETSKVVTVSVAGDTSLEADEGFTLTLSNPSAGLVIGTATASGTIQNDDTAPPVAAHGDAYVVKQGQALAPSQPLTTGALANDESAATASLLDGPDHGTLQLAGNGTFTYTPAAGFHGIDTFGYRAGNAGPTMDQAQVTIHVVPVSAGSQPTLDLVGLTAEEQIAATYTAFFGRAADAGGLDFWVGQFVSNLPAQGPAALFANIASSFGVSGEAKGLYPFLADPFHATDGQIAAFLNSVYDNLFNRTPDAGGLGYWTDQVKQTLQANQFVGSVLVNIMSGAQDTATGKDITTLMGKVAVSLAYVREQHEHETGWLPGDNAAARTLLDPVTADPASVLVGVRNAESLIAAHA